MTKNTSKLTGLPNYEAMRDSRRDDTLTTRQIFHMSGACGITDAHSDEDHQP